MELLCRINNINHKPIVHPDQLQMFGSRTLEVIRTFRKNVL